MKKYLIGLLIILGLSAVAFYFLGQRQKPASAVQVEQPVTQAVEQEEVPADVQGSEKQQQEQSATSRRKNRYFEQMQEGKLPEPTQPYEPEVVEQPAPEIEKVAEPEKEPKVAVQRKQIQQKPVQKKVSKKVASANKAQKKEPVEQAKSLFDDEGFRQHIADVQEKAQELMKDPKFLEELEQRQQMALKQIEEDPELQAKFVQQKKMLDAHIKKDPVLKAIQQKMDKDPSSVTQEEAMALGAAIGTIVSAGAMEQFAPST